MTAYNDRAVRRTPEQQLAASQLMAQRAKSKIRNREQQKVSARHLVAGRLLNKAAAEGDAQARAILNRLVETLSTPTDRALFGLQPLGAGRLAEAIWDQVDVFIAAQDRGDDVAVAAAAEATIRKMMIWEVATNSLWPDRSTEWARVPGCRH